jgi:hypothetical protein
VPIFLDANQGSTEKDVADQFFDENQSRKTRAKTHRSVKEDKSGDEGVRRLNAFRHIGRREITNVDCSKLYSNRDYL